MTRLTYIGRLTGFNTAKDLRMWTVHDPKSPFNGSSRTWSGLVELGIVKTCSTR